MVLRDGSGSATAGAEGAVAGARAAKKAAPSSSSEASSSSSVPEEERVRAADALLFSDLGLSKALVRSELKNKTCVFRHIVQRVVCFRYFDRLSPPDNQSQPKTVAPVSS